MGDAFMLSDLPAFLTGLIALSLYTLNVIFIGIMIFLAFLLKCISPWKAGRAYFHRMIFAQPAFWTRNNERIKNLTSRFQWEIHLPEGLSLKQCYLVTCNHQSWADIMILCRVFNQKIPMLKFFLKKQLIWVPFIGWASWIFGFPFMQRYTKAQLEKNPALRARDREAARRACEGFKKELGSIINFSEGTRFRAHKHITQKSPYHYLLKPKAGGLALALRYMDGLIDTLLNTTIIYPKGKSSLWQVCCGKFDKIIIHVEKIKLPDDLHGDYENDENYRKHFQDFMQKLWQQKDELIQQYYGK